MSDPDASALIIPKQTVVRFDLIFRNETFNSSSMTHALKEDQTCIKDYSEKSSLLDARTFEPSLSQVVRLQNGGECRPFMGQLTKQ